MGRPEPDLVAALADERELRRLNREEARRMAIRLHRLCPEMRIPEIARRAGISERTLHRWLVEAKNDS